MPAVQLTYFQHITAPPAYLRWQRETVFPRASRPHKSITQLFQLALFYREETERLRRLLCQMLPGDALLFDAWRLEQVQLDRGLEHYRLYQHDVLVGIKDIRSEKVMEAVQADMSRFLALIGFVAARTELVEEGAKTPADVSLDTAKNRAGQLWVKTYSGRPRRQPEPFSISALLN